MSMRTKILVIIVFIAAVANAEVQFGVKVANNKWDNHWVLTPGAELIFSGKWFLIETDGTFGLFSLAGIENGYAYQLSFAFTPMVRIPLIGPAFAAAGYGVNYSYRRKEIQAPDGNYLLASEEKIRGQILGFLGLEIPITSSMKIYGHGGISFIDEANQRFFGSAGVNLAWPPAANKNGKSNARNGSFAANRLELSGSEEMSSTIMAAGSGSRKIALIGSDDSILNELISTLEISLLENDYSIYNWEKVHSAVMEYQQNRPDSRILSDSLSAFPGRKQAVAIALEGAKLFNLDAIVDIMMRYEFNPIDQSIAVLSAFIRMIQPQTGEILWATEYRGGNQDFSHCKKTLSDSMIQALKKQFSSK